MPSKDVQRHKHMPIMPNRMLIMRIINHMFIMHITIHFIQQLLHNKMSLNTCSDFKQHMHKMFINKLPQMLRQWFVLQLCLWLLIAQWCLFEHMPGRVQDKWNTLQWSYRTKFIIIRQHVPRTIVNRYSCRASSLHDVKTPKPQNILSRCCLLTSGYHLNFSLVVLHLLVLCKRVLSIISHRYVCRACLIRCAVFTQFTVYYPVNSLVLW